MAVVTPLDQQYLIFRVEDRAAHVDLRRGMALLVSEKALDLFDRPIRAGRHHLGGDAADLFAALYFKGVFV